MAGLQLSLVATALVPAVVFLAVVKVVFAVVVALAVLVVKVVILIVEHLRLCVGLPLRLRLTGRRLFAFLRLDLHRDEGVDVNLLPLPLSTLVGAPDDG